MEVFWDGLCMFVVICNGVSILFISAYICLCMHMYIRASISVCVCACVCVSVFVFVRLHV